MANEEAVRELIALREQIKRAINLGPLSDIVEIGDFSYSGGGLNIIPTDYKTCLTLGKFCSLAQNVIIVLAPEHRTDWTSTYPFNVVLKSYSYIEGHPKYRGDITIGNDVWVAIGAKILPGVTIGDGAVIGAYTVVSKDVPAYHIATGAGGGFKTRPRFDSDTINRLCEIKWWDWELEHIAEIIPLLQSDNVKGVIDYYDNVVCKIKKPKTGDLL